MWKKIDQKSPLSRNIRGSRGGSGPDRNRGSTPGPSAGLSAQQPGQNPSGQSDSNSTSTVARSSIRAPAPGSSTNRSSARGQQDPANRSRSRDRNQPRSERSQVSATSTPGEQSRRSGQVGSSSNGTNPGRNAARNQRAVTPIDAFGPYLGRFSREVRDIIYYYLLKGANNKCYHHEEPEWESKHNSPTSPRSHYSGLFSYEYHKFAGRAYGYRFHTELMRANRYFETEVREMLVAENTFVVIGIYGCGLNRAMHLADVPVINTRGSLCPRAHDSFRDQYKSFPHWSVFLQLHWKDCDWAIKEHGGPKITPDHRPFLMLLEDLPELFKMMRFISGYIPPKVVKVLSDRGSPLRAGVEYFDPAEDDPFLEVLVRNDHRAPDTWSGFKVLPEDGEKKLALDVEGITGFGYRCRNVTMRSGPLWHDIRKRMSPLIVWPSAKIYDMLQIAFERKKAIDTFIDEGDTTAAYERACYLRDYLFKLDIVVPLQDEDDPRVIAMWRQYLHLRADVALTSVSLSLRPHCVPEDLFTFFTTPRSHDAFMDKIIRDTGRVDEMSLAPFTPDVKAHNDRFFLLRYFFRQAFNVIQDKTSNRSLLRRLLNDVYNVHSNSYQTSLPADVLSDCNIIEDYLTRKKIDTSEEAALIQTLSPFALPRTFQEALNQPSPAYAKREISKWQNTLHKAALTRAEKDEILERGRTGGELGSRKRVDVTEADFELV